MSLRFSEVGKCAARKLLKQRYRNLQRPPVSALRECNISNLRQYMDFTLFFVLRSIFFGKLPFKVAYGLATEAWPMVNFVY